MRKLLTLTTMLFLALTFVACGADGELDEALLNDYVDRFQEEVMPTKEEFKRIAEKQIANLPEDEQADARRDLEKALAEWPTDEDFDEMVDKIKEDLPSGRELDEALSEISEEGGIFGRMISGAVRGAVENAPSPEEVNSAVDKTMDEVSKQVDSLRKAN